MNILLYSFQDAYRVLQFFIGDPHLKFPGDPLNKGLGPGPDLFSDLCEVYVADPHVCLANLTTHQALLFHVLYQSGQGGLGPVGDKGQLVLNSSVLFMQVLEQKELFFGKIDALFFQGIREIIADELGGFANPGNDAMFFLRGIQFG